MKPTLYLTPTELALFQALSDSVKGEWKGRTELDDVEDAFETREQMEMRMHLIASEDHPEVKHVVEEAMKNLEKGEPLDTTLLEKIPASSMPVVCLGMGVIGMSAFLELVIPTVTSSMEFEGLAALSKVRHILAECNVGVAASAS